MGVRLLGAGVRQDDPAPAPGQDPAGDSRAARQLAALAAGFPALADRAPRTGLYQGLGLEKRQVYAALAAAVEAEGFARLDGAALAAAYQPAGPFLRLGAALDAPGPAYAIEGDAIAGGMALLTALEDLTAGRCARALVGGYRLQAPRAWLMLLAHEPAHRTRWKAVFAHGRKAPAPEDLAALGEALGAPPTLVAGDPVADPLGHAAHAALLEACEGGGAFAVWSQAADGRGLLLGIRHGES